VDNRSDIREFLVTRRARVTPEQAGLVAYGRNRRVPGLRREEVAMLAGVSIDYYTQIERGKLSGVSDSVLDAIATALRFDEAKREHLSDLARSANAPSKPRRRPARDQVRPTLQHLIDAMTEAPALVRNARMDILAANRLGRALYSPARSQPFRERWAAHNVRLHRTGLKRFRHPVVGELSLGYESMELDGGKGQKLTAYTAEPGSSAHDALKLLASWSATVDSPATA
jgi:transcriptional regulator with XRE-family HTH domain